jgi:predicted AAA+ superfamily ATPase
MLVERKNYVSWLENFKEKNFIKVVSGVRRCGKSTLFKIYIDKLLENGVLPEQIISINLEDLDFEHLQDYRALYDYIKNRLHPDLYSYIFIDEIQECKNYEKAIDSLFIKERTDIYITGSNAHLLSGELATLLSGRYVMLQMLPLSFSEYMQFGEDCNFEKYIKYGSFPAISVLENNESLINTYLDGIYSSILIKDVSTRLGISDVKVLEDIVKFLFGNIGSMVSVRNMSNVLSSTGRAVSVNTVDKYLQALCDSYLFYEVGRYDIKGKQHLKTQSKYYCVDMGLRSRLLAGSNADIGHIIENIVFLELMRRGYKVNIGKVAEKEVDFVVQTDNSLEYYQVSASVLDENTLQRELAPLRAIRDNYPKILLTLDTLGSGGNFDGILQINLIDWLKNTP